METPLSYRVSPFPILGTVFTCSILSDLNLERSRDRADIFRVLPLSFVPLRFLAFSSFLGVLTTWGIIGILCFSGIATYVPLSPSPSLLSLSLSGLAPDRCDFITDIVEMSEKTDIDQRTRAWIIERPYANFHLAGTWIGQARNYVRVDRCCCKPLSPSEHLMFLTPD